MALGRKFKIWLVSFAIVLSVFVLYILLGDTGNLEVAKQDFGLDVADFNVAAADANAGRIGDAKLEYLQQARFETLDEKTRKLKRVVGFERVLHKSGDQWELEKPFMNVFQDDLRCDVNSDSGTIEVENVKGVKPAPKNALLKGNVVIHIMPTGGGSGDESFIYLDEVNFDGDKSMFTSDGKILVKSADAELKGKGLEILYNAITSQLEYLEIKKVDYLHIKTLGAAAKIKADRRDAAKSDDGGSGELTVLQKRTESDGPTAGNAKKADKASSGQVENQDDYQCIFRKDVVIEYEDSEVVLADEVAISNLLWSSSESQDSQVRQTGNGAVGSEAVSENHSQARQEAVTPQVGSGVANGPVVRVFAVVKCSGPMIVKPRRVEGYEFKPGKFRKFAELSQSRRDLLGRRNVLIAQQIDYDYVSEVVRADGDVEMVFYPEGQDSLPASISSKRGADYRVAQKQANFYGDVAGRLISKKIGYDEKNVFYGDKLTVDLVGDNEAVSGSTKVSKISISGKDVWLESVKSAGDDLLSHVMLLSKKIDYYGDSGKIIAWGGGRIEYNNREDKSGGAEKDGADDLGMGRPCFGLMEGFDKLVWDTKTMNVKAFSNETGGIHIGYVPFVDGQRGKIVTIDTRQLDIDYSQYPDGRAELEKLEAAGGIVYYEEDKYSFSGDKLQYFARENYLRVTSPENASCMFNGALVDGVEYNIETGQANAVIGRGVGVLPVKEQ